MLLEGIVLALGIAISVGLHTLRTRGHLDDAYSAALKWGERVSWFVIVGVQALLAGEDVLDAGTGFVRAIDRVLTAIVLLFYDVGYVVRHGKRRPEAEPPLDRTTGGNG